MKSLAFENITILEDVLKTFYEYLYICLNKHRFAAYGLIAVDDA